MREDIQKHGARQLSRREEWARPVRGVHRRGAFCLTFCPQTISLMRFFTRSNRSRKRRKDKSWLSCAIKWPRKRPARLPRKRKKQKRTSSSDARQEKYVYENWTLTHRRAINCGTHTHRTGSRADQRGSKEQADAKRARSKAPRFVTLSFFRLCHHNASFVEKENDKKALAAIKAQIEADKQERAQKAAQEKALREGGTTAAVATTSAPAPAVAAPAPAVSSTPGREFKETRLQIRLASGGQPLTTTLPSDSSCVPFLLL